MSNKEIDWSKVFAQKEYPEVFYTGNGSYWVKKDYFSEPFICSKQLAMTYIKKHGK